MTGSRHATTLTSLLLVMICALTVYYPTMQYEFVWDDVSLVTQEPVATRQAQWHTAFTTTINSLYRPLQTLSFAAQYSPETDPSPYHMANVLLFAAACSVFFLFVNLILRNIPAALLASLIYAVHPVHAGSVSCVSVGRASILEALFLFSALALHLNARDQHIPFRRSLFFTLATIASFIAMLARETALIIPLLVILIDTFVSNGRGNRLRRNRIILNSLPYITAAALFTLLRSAFTNGPDITSQIQSAATIEHLDKVLSNMPRIFNEYAAMLAWPVKLCPIYNPHLLFFGISDQTGLPVGILLCIFIFFISFIRTKPMITFSGLWFFACLIPISNLIPMSSQHIKAAHYMTIAVTGYCILLAYLFSLASERLTFRGRHTFLGLAACCLIAVYAMMCLPFRNVWKDNLTLWRRATYCAPTSFLAHHNYGIELYKRSDYPNAASSLRHAMVLRPDILGIRENYAKTLIATGNYEEALKLSRILVVAQPNNAEYRRLEAQLMLLTGKEADLKKWIINMKSKEHLDESSRQHLDMVQKILDGKNIQ